MTPRLIQSSIRNVNMEKNTRKMSPPPKFFRRSFSGASLPHWPILVTSSLPRRLIGQVNDGFKSN